MDIDEFECALMKKLAKLIEECHQQYTKYGEAIYIGGMGHIDAISARTKLDDLGVEQARVRTALVEVRKLKEANNA